MAKKGKAQLRDLGLKKSGEEFRSRAQKTTTRGYRKQYEALRLKEKAANERMRQLEKRGIKSPAYQAVQAKLEVLGKSTKGDRGRRFSETGKATYSERELLNKILDEFLGQQTSTVTGAKKYNEDIWETANKNQRLEEAGISRSDWGRFWESLPDKKDRIYGSEQYVAMIRAYSKKHGGLADENAFSVEEIAAEIEAQKDLKSAYRALGLDTKEVLAAKIKRGKK